MATLLGDPEPARVYLKQCAAVPYGIGANSIGDYRLYASKRPVRAGYVHQASRSAIAERYH